MSLGQPKDCRWGLAGPIAAGFKSWAHPVFMARLIALRFDCRKPFRRNVPGSNFEAVLPSKNFQALLARYLWYCQNVLGFFITLKMA
jgi:hypothetical protein